MDTQPIAVELLPSAMRTNIVVLVHSDMPIEGSQLVEALTHFCKELKNKLEAQKSKIAEVKKPNIIMP